jgi:hypothetical protein
MRSDERATNGRVGNGEPKLGRPLKVSVLCSHRADLTLRDERGAPKYVGLSAVRDALLAGECETCATTHMVTERVDDGPVMLGRGRFPCRRSPSGRATARPATCCAPRRGRSANECCAKRGDRC